MKVSYCLIEVPKTYFSITQSIAERIFQVYHLLEPNRVIDAENEDLKQSIDNIVTENLLEENRLVLSLKEKCSQCLVKHGCSNQ